MKTTPGTLYGIGVGPGDPELVPVKSARILGQVDIIFAAASTKNSYSLAVNIARPYIPETTPVQVLQFPMTTEAQETWSAWEDNARTLIASLEAGKDIAFLTLGDSMTYSTYGYILKQVKRLAPHLPVVTIPGITSYQAAAACLNTPLVEGEESLMLVSGAQGGNRLRHVTEKPDTIVFLKAYRNIGDISQAIDEAGVYQHCVGVSNCGLPEQKIIPDLHACRDQSPDYWTLIIAHQKP
jgi:precorrin-2/cobalt-factor-2 C20-methyltransferase